MRTTPISLGIAEAFGRTIPRPMLPENVVGTDHCFEWLVGHAGASQAERLFQPPTMILPDEWMTQIYTGARAIPQSRTYASTSADGPVAESEI